MSAELLNTTLDNYNQIGEICDRLWDRYFDDFHVYGYRYGVDVYASNAYQAKGAITVVELRAEVTFQVSPTTTDVVHLGPFIGMATFKEPLPSDWDSKRGYEIATAAALRKAAAKVMKVVEREAKPKPITLL